MIVGVADEPGRESRIRAWEVTGRFEKNKALSLVARASHPYSRSDRRDGTGRDATRRASDITVLLTEE
ncbi:hypothetical protein [Haloquadratum walsbyi]|uniref:Uncharacterized protein n=1 Tax=Haloquadratum walsbyi J07HQW2 TaxID=1238425 RepID=U1NB29_9EURY|nr:hypothetical protein [Haloquadratum walsbyi]ERG93828.1 MAG: hypothetical protein J07HQW2_00262 [Haloquadratum walsbyi J07HQW2]